MRVQPDTDKQYDPDDDPDTEPATTPEDVERRARRDQAEGDDEPTAGADPPD